jgi:hypothetical protein
MSNPDHLVEPRRRTRRFSMNRRRFGRNGSGINAMSSKTHIAGSVLQQPVGRLRCRERADDAAEQFGFEQALKRVARCAAVVQEGGNGFAECAAHLRVVAARK